MPVPACARRACSVICFLALALATSAQASQSGDGIWTDVAVDDVLLSAAIAPRAVMPQAYRSLRIDQAALDKVLSFAPAESAVRVADSTVTLQLPLPDGHFESFRIVDSPVMAAELAARFPQIRSWLGQGIDDPTATVRLDRSHKGFHAQIISWRGTVLIDPLAPGDRDHAMVYHKRDAQMQGERPVCQLTGDKLPRDLPDFSKRGVVPKFVSGDTLRIHRLAMAATGEYTQFHGGTVANGLAAINTTMNRVNGIYERDLAVRMVLIPNNHLIVYTNGATDPYSNNNGFAMLTQNQTNLDNVIGNANYDIGHVFSTGGGGIASLDSVCWTGFKAQGVTGLAAPAGDAFDVDFVAHEIGHQYNGRHTFNGVTGSCSGGNRDPGSAYEPGSGMTIQAYAGICGADNLQANSADYFHRVSLDQMLAYVSTGTGSTCGIASPTGNTPPQVTTAAAFTIPQHTPFQLTAAGSDADGDTLTYIWEQFDLGAANPAGTLVDDGSRPIFRNFVPTLEPTRIFPSLRYILNNANNVPPSAPLPGSTSPDYFTGEVLPSTNRTMNFRVTVRDNRADGGGTGDALTQVTVSTNAGPFRVTSPNTAVSWPAGSVQTFTWEVAGTDVAPINTNQVVIALSIDGGLTFPMQTPPLPNDGNIDVILPNIEGTTQARVRVSAVNNIYFDISDVDFEIVGAPMITSIEPGSGPTAGGTAVTISGNAFRDGDSVSFAGVACTDIIVTVPDSIACTTPPGTGLVDVTVTNIHGQSSTLASAYAYIADPPMITGVSPGSGTAAGGTDVIISGNAFQNGASASFGGVACTDVTVTVPNSIACTTPAGTVGLVDVIVSNPDSQSATLVNGYEYSRQPTTTTINASADPVRIGESESFDIEVNGVSALADGQVTVTASSGENCSDSMPQVDGDTASFSCQISFATLGPRTLSASFSDSATHLDSSSAPLNLSVARFADLSVSISDGQATVLPGESPSYLIEVRNLGPDEAPGSLLVLASIPELQNPNWTCSPVGSALCPALSGTGELGAPLNLPADSGLDFIQSGMTDTQLDSDVIVTVNVSSSAASPNFVFDPDSGNNQASDLNLLETVFSDGFE